jgi:hypothetical protein
MLKKETLPTTASRPTYISHAVHPDSYRDRGHLSFTTDYLEDHSVTELL